MFGKGNEKTYTKVFNHGDKVRCKITNFEGTVTGHSDYMNGCDHYHVQPEVTKEGAFQEGKWFDEADLELIVEKPVVEVKEKAKATGGPLLCKPP